MPAPVVWGRPGINDMKRKPPHDRREIARNVRGRAIDCGHFLPADAPEAVRRDLRRFRARV